MIDSTLNIWFLDWNRFTYIASSKAPSLEGDQIILHTEQSGEQITTIPYILGDFE